MTNPLLKRSTDRKVTNRVTASGNPAGANSFGLPAGRQFSCSGATDYCASICYAGKLEKVYKGVSAVLLHNWEALRDASPADMQRMLSDMIRDFDCECEKSGAPRLFRIHWDGDFFSPAYVTAWWRVIRDFPHIRFWAYTRVASAALFLHAQKLPNLSLYFSADRDNVESARAVSARGVRVAYVGPTFADGKTQFRRAAKCPENASRKLPDGSQSFPLITSDGSACVRCGICIRGDKDVLFSASKR